MAEGQRRALEQEVWVLESPTAKGTEGLFFSRAEVGITGKEVLSDHIRV